MVGINTNDKGIGAALMQKGRLIAFINKELSTRNQFKSIYEKELLPILYAVS